MMFLITSLGRTRLGLVARPSLLTRSVPRTVPFRALARGRTSQPLHSLRFQMTSKRTGSTEAASKSTTPNFRYPGYPLELCVYYAGTGRIMFLASLKFATLLIFGIYGFFVTPVSYTEEGLSLHVAQSAIAAVVPLAFVAYTTSPFVAFIHMRIPPFARQSEELLRRYVRTLPPHAELIITTMSIIAKPRTSTVKLSDLAPVNRRFGIVNLARDTAAENAKRKWYMFRAVGNFSVQRASGTTKVPWVWDAVRSKINITL